MKFKIVLEWQVVNMKCYPLFMLCNIISFFSCFKQHTKYFILFIYMELQRNITQWYGGQCHGRRGHQHLGAGRVRGGGGQRVSAPAVRLVNNVNIVINFFTTIQYHYQLLTRYTSNMGDGDTRSLALDRVEEALAAARETGVISYPNMRLVTRMMV